MLFFGICTVNCVKLRSALKKVAHKQATYFFKQLFKYFFSEGAEYTTPFIALVCKTGDKRKDGIKNCGKEKNQILLRNTDYLISGKSTEKQSKKNNNIKTTNSLHFFKLCTHQCEHTEQRGGFLMFHTPVTSFPSVCEYDK